MNAKLQLARGAAVLAAVASLAGVAAVAAPTAASAATVCGNKSVKVPIEGGRSSHVPVKAVSTEGGVSCATAFKVIGDTLGGKPPKGWKSVVAHYELPKKLSEEGLFPGLITNGGKKIKFAIHGG